MKTRTPATYRMPVADCVERRLMQSCAMYTNIAGTSKPTSQRVPTSSP